MRKVILYILLFISCVSYSQDSLYCEYVQLGEWKEKKQEYKFKKPKKTVIKFIFEDAKISVEDNVSSVYVLLEKVESLEDDSKLQDVVTFSAEDERHSACIIMMYPVDNWMILAVLYENVCFRYYFEN